MRKYCRSWAMKALSLRHLGWPSKTTPCVGVRGHVSDRREAPRFEMIRQDDSHGCNVPRNAEPKSPPRVPPINAIIRFYSAYVSCLQCEAATSCSAVNRRVVGMRIKTRSGEAGIHGMLEI